ncbi:DUF4097 family beta strand repeat-containing protein [Pontibacter locisalis]|uniref:DUF4097 family beta strand repeat-containing protein n=1 Tax=Pontibacter locisalis TaxID=1719035 RepID=A0ABW5ILC4_9BACT
MKKIMLLASVCLMLNSFPLLAQTSRSGVKVRTETEKKEPRVYKAKLDNSKNSRIIITMYNSGVQVVGHNADEVVVESSSYTQPPARAAGLKPLYNQAVDNTGLGLAITKENNTMKIDKASRQDGNYIIRVPKNASVVYTETNWTGDDVSMSDLNGEIELKLNNSNANLTNITGPLVANTTSSDMVIKFANLNQSKPSAISSVAGTVDITLPANTKADFKLKSIQGEIYSDFDLNTKNNSKNGLTKVAGGNTIEGAINGGGAEMTLYTISGDMFIRKNK